MGKKDEFALSKRELDVMNVLWGAGKPLIASDIPERDKRLSINTVQAVLKKLLQRGFIKVDKIVHSGTVLTRSYSPEITPEEYAVKYVTSEIFPFGQSMFRTGFLDALFESTENEEELIGELEEFIMKKKDGRKGGEEGCGGDNGFHAVLSDL